MKCYIHLIVRVPNRVLQSRYPNPEFRSIPSSRRLFPTSRAYFQYQILLPYCFLFLNTGLQLRQIPHPEKSTEDPQNEAGNPDCYLWHPASRAYFQYQVSPLYCFKIPKPGLQMGRIPDPEKPFDDPQLFPLDFRNLLCNESQIK